MNEVGQRLRTLREGIKASQQAIADTIGTTQSNINRYEMGHSSPPLKILVWYADYFDVSMDYIFNRTDKPEGKLYNNEPKALQERAKNEEDWNKFVEMCFDPKSPMNTRLKNTLKEIMTEAKK